LSRSCANTAWLVGERLLRRARPTTRAGRPPIRHPVTTLESRCGRKAGVDGGAAERGRCGWRRMPEAFCRVMGLPQLQIVFADRAQIPTPPLAPDRAEHSLETQGRGDERIRAEQHPTDRRCNKPAGWQPNGGRARRTHMLEETLYRGHTLYKAAGGTINAPTRPAADADRPAMSAITNDCNGAL
jgi:hypothetical protein